MLMWITNLGMGGGAAPVVTPAALMYRAILNTRARFRFALDTPATMRGSLNARATHRATLDTSR